MAHGRKFSKSKRSPDSERYLFEQKLMSRYSRSLDRTDVLNLIKGGEDTHLEFKLRLVNTEKVTAEIVALANSGGGAIMFGVNDQRRIEGLDDPEQVEEQLLEICRQQIKPALLPRLDKVYFDNGARIVVMQVDDRRAPHRTPDNRYFIRIGSTKREADGNEIAALFARSRVAAFEDLPLLSARIEEVDEALVWTYVRELEGESFREPAGFPTPQAMRDLRLATDCGAMIVPTLAGFLLFGRSPEVQKVIPQSRVVMIRYSGINVASPVVEQAEINGNLTAIYDKAIAFLQRYVDLRETRPPRNATPNGLQEPIPARANYSCGAVTEALTNLLTHRDYSLVGLPSRLLVFDDRLEFINAMRTNGTTRKSVEYGAILQENPRLHRIFTRSEYGCQSWLHGLPALRRAQLAFAKREPRISLLNDEFHLELGGV
ncbi:MAG: putative DNA binding domain-containing protein [Acidobacteria bacterium]|nr:putative DNA binding domain-containing protein [Acidobacteriota bacterium]